MNAYTEGPTRPVVVAVAVVECPPVPAFRCNGMAGMSAYGRAVARQAVLD